MAVRPPSSKAPAAAAPPGPAAVPALIPQGAHAGKPAMPLQRPFILIGSRNRAHVHLVSHTVSRAHAAVINTDHGSYVRDLGSRTHTFVNARPMKEAPLHHADALQFGSFQFRYSDKSGRGDVDRAPRAPRAVLHAQGVEQPVPIEGWTLLIGQKPVCDVYIADAAVSTAHALIFELNGRHYVRDLGSRTGTLVNGRPAHQEVLEYGDEIRIGPASMRYASADADVSRLDEDEALQVEPLAGTGIGVAATTAIGTAAAMEEFPLDLTVTESEPDVVATAPAAAGLQVEAGDIDPFPLEAEVPPIAVTDVVADVEAEEPVIPIAVEPEPLPPLPDRIPVPPLPLGTAPDGSAAFWPHAPAPAEPLPGEAATEADVFGTAGGDAAPSGADAGLAPGAWGGAAPPPAEVPEPSDDWLRAEPEETHAPAPAPAAPETAPPARHGAAQEPVPQSPFPPDEAEPSLADLEALAGPAAPASGELPPAWPRAGADAPDSSFADFAAPAVSPASPIPAAAPFVSATAPVGPADPLSFADDVPALEPLDFADDAPPRSPAGRVGASPPPPPEEVNPLDLALDFPPEPESQTDLAADLAGDPFGPLTDMNLMSHLEPSRADAARAGAGPVLDPPPDPQAVVAPAPPAAADRLDDDPRRGALDVAPAAPEAVEPSPQAQLSDVDTAARPAETVGTYADLGLSFEGEPTPEAPAQPAWSPAPGPDVFAPEPAAPEPAATPEPTAADVSATAAADVDLLPADDAATTFVPPPGAEVAPTEPPAAEAPAPLEAPGAPSETPAAAGLSVAEPPVAGPGEAGVRVVESSSVEAPAAEGSALDVAPVALDIAVEAAPPAAAEASPAKATKRRRKPAAPKAPAAPKKKKWWGKKSAEDPADAPPAVAEPAEVAQAETGPVEAVTAVTASIETAAEVAATEAAPADAAAPLDATAPVDAAPADAAPAEAFPAEATPAVAAEEASAAAEARSADDAVVAPPQEAVASVEETVALTEPTPESALDLPLVESREFSAASAGWPQSPLVSATADPAAAQDPAAPDAPDDAAFDAILAEFSGPSAGPIVEEPAGAEAAGTQSPEPLAAGEGEFTATAAEPVPGLDFPADAPRAEFARDETPAGLADDRDALDLSPEDVARYDEPRLEDLEALQPPAAAAPHPAAPAPAAPVPFDPFRGMGRDEGSFIGGMPFDFGTFAPLGEPVGSPPAPALPEARALPEAPGRADPGFPSLEDLESIEPAFPAAPRVSATTSAAAPPAAPGFPDASEPDLDLSLPDLPDFDAPPASPAPGAPAGATAAADALGDTSLDLPDLPPLDLPPLDLPDAAPVLGQELPSLDPPLEFPPAGSAGATSGRDEGALDPLSFTEAEAETLQLLPRPEPPRGAPPRNEPPRTEPPRAAPASPPARGERPRPTPPPPARAGRAQPYPAKTPPPARGGATRRPVRDPFDLDAELGSAFDIPPSAPPRGGKPAAPGAKGAGAVTGGFNGLAMPPVREADVFSPLSFGASDVIPPVPPAKPAGAGGKPAPPPRGQDGPPADTDEDLAAALDLPPAGLESDLGLGSGLGATRPGEASAPVLGLTGLASTGPATRRARRPGTSPRDIGRGSPAGAPPGGPGFGADRWDGPGGPPDAAVAPPAGAAPVHGAPPAPSRRRLGVTVLLLLMIVSLAGASLGIWFLGPRPQTEVVGRLQFDRLRDLTTYERQSFEQRQQKVLGDPGFRMQAREILKVADPDVPYGFLGEETDAVKAYQNVVRDARAKERSNDFVVYYRGHDAAGDRLRMQAVLKALAARNAPAKDEAADVQRKYQEAQDALKAAVQQVEERKKLIASMREQGERMPQLEQRLKQLEAEDARLSAAARAAQREVNRLRAELEQAEAPAAAPAQPAGAQDAPQADVDAPADGAAEGAGPQLVAISSKASAVPAADLVQDRDPQVRQWRIQLDQLRGAARSAKAERAGRLEQASKALDAALEQFNAEVGEAGRKLRGESPLESQLRRYVAAGQKMQDALRDAGAELDRQQKADREFLGDMKRRLAEKTETRLKDAWANDAELRGLEDELAITERHRNAARGGGLKQEAASLDAKIVELGRQIETRRDLVGTGRAYTGEVQEIQEFIDRTLKRMEDERGRNDKRMEGLLAGFAAEAPAAEKLPEDQKALAAGLGRRSGELAEARRRYAAALAAADAAADADAEMQGRQAAALQAKIDTRRRRAAVLASQEQLTDQQRKEGQAKVERLKRELAVALQAEAKANAAAEASLEALRQARVDLAAARDSADKIAAAQRDQVAAEQGLEALRAQGEALQRDLAKRVRPNDPGDDAVTVNPGDDPRLLRILYTDGAIVVVFSLLMWFAATGSAAPAAERATYDVLAPRQPPEGTVRRGAGGANGTDPADDDEPLTV